jgi:hypothetical protein
MPIMTGFFEELQKRKVYRVAAAYIIAAVREGKSMPA